MNVEASFGFALFAAFSAILTQIEFFYCVAFCSLYPGGLFVLIVTLFIKRFSSCPGTRLTPAYKHVTLQRVAAV